MTIVRVQSFSVSLDGFGASSEQDLAHSLHMRGPEHVFQSKRA